MGHVNECRTALVKNSFQESFYITFMGNKKSYQNINCFFTFFHKNNLLVYTLYTLVKPI